MSQAESDPTGFAAFATFLGTPLPENPIRALRVLRYEAAREIERLIDFLDALGGDPDLEDGADAEPTLGWPPGRPICVGSVEDGELEPSLGWTGNINQASRNRLGDGEDFEKDDSEREPSLGGLNRVNQEGWASGLGNELEDEHDGTEPDHDNEPNGDEGDVSASPTPEYKKRLFVRRGQWREPRPAPDICNVGPLENLSLVIIGPDGKPWEIDRLGYPVVR